MMKENENGFTLLEMLLVLGIWSVLILLSFPLVNTSIENHQEKQFLKMLQNDVLYTQNHSYGSDLYVRIVFFEHGYNILNTTNGELLRIREVPKGWSIQIPRPLRQLSFTGNGTIQQSGTIIIKTNHNRYQVIFPPGKGRGYIEQI